MSLIKTGPLAHFDCGEDCEEPMSKADVKGWRVLGTLAELEAEIGDSGEAILRVIYYRGGEWGDDEMVKREFLTVREATGFMASIASNKLRAWKREQ